MADSNKQNKSEIKYPWEVLLPVKNYLSDKLTLLEKRRKSVSEADPFSDSARLDDNAAIDADAAEQVGHLEASALKQTLDKSMIQIRKALTMIKLGKYGICEKCGKMIDTDRLMVMPETTVCVNCGKKREK